MTNPLIHAVALLIAIASTQGAIAQAQPAGPPSQRVEARTAWLAEGRVALRLGPLSRPGSCPR